MSNIQRPPQGERRIVHVEWKGRTKYTYYDDGLVKITRYKARRKIYWGRIFAAIIVFVLLVMGIVQLCKAAFAAVSGGGKEIGANGSMPSESSSSESMQESLSSADADISSAADESSESDTDESGFAEYQNMNLTVCIDPGHGDYDKGTVADDGTTESSQNLEIALLVKDYLEECGVTVIMTRDSDTAVSLSERCTTANQANADMFISLHRNSVSDYSGEQGVEIWVNNNQPQYDSALAENILSALGEVGISQDLGVKYGYSGMPNQNYQINMDTVMPSVLVELGFIDNETDNQLFEENKSDYARAIGNAAIKTAIELGVVGEDGSRLLGEQLISDGKSNVTENY